MNIINLTRVELEVLIEALDSYRNGLEDIEHLADFDKEEELEVATQMEDQLTSIRAYAASDNPEERRKLLRLVQG